MTAPDPLAPIRARLAEVTAGWAARQSLADIRAGFAAYLAEVGPQGAALARPRPATAPVPAAWIGPEAAPGSRPALYLHGGGFQIGGIASHSGLIARLAAAADTPMLAVDYRLAPEHRWPAAAEDALAAYRWMTEQGPAPAILGDSAGGALALRLAQQARDAGLPLPRALVLISPWLDLSMQGDSYRRLADGDIFSRPEQLRAMARSYLGRGGPDPASPDVSPLWGDLAALPPVLVQAGAADITLDDSHTLARRMAEAGGRLELQVFPGMCHHFQIFEALPQTAAAVAAIGAFLRRF